MNHKESCRVMITMLRNILLLMKYLVLLGALLGLASCSEASPLAQAGLPAQTAASSAALAQEATPAPTASPLPPQPSATLGPSLTPSSTPTITLTPTPSATPTETLTPSITPTSTPDTRPLPDYWGSWPIIPTVSGGAAAAYRRGVELGNDPHSFTRIGDCQSVPEVFLGIYDTDRYWFGENYTYLQRTVDHFKGAFSRPNVTARDGFSVLSMFSALYADPNLCQANETPLECEYRLNKPAYALISLGTNWQPGVTEKFEKNLRKVVEVSLEHGVVPILMTKADDIEGDNTLNRSIAQVAYDYDVPLLNSWLAVQYLPNHGLQEDGIYLTPDAWDERSFTALMTLDRFWTTLEGVPNP